MSTYMPVERPILSLQPWRSRQLLKWLPWSGVCLGVLLVSGLALGPASRRSASPLAALPVATAAGVAPVLEVRGTEAERRHGFLTITGEVTNVSSRRLRTVEAVVEFRDAEGRLRGVESSLLEFSTLRPGEASPFAVFARDRSELTAYRVRFRQLLGPALAAR